MSEITQVAGTLRGARSVQSAGRSPRCIRVHDCVRSNHAQHLLQRLCRNLAENMDRVNADREPVLITRDRKAAAVLMSLEDYASFEETRYLLLSPRNAERLFEATQALERGAGDAHELFD